MRRFCSLPISRYLLLALCLLGMLGMPGLGCKKSDGFPDRLQILSLLDNRDFDGLEKLLHGFQKEAEKDVTREIYAAFAFETFCDSKPSHEAILNHWVAVHPNSYAAHIAAAEHSWHFAQLQWASRGTEVSPEQRRRIDTALDQAARHAKSALLLRPQVMEGHYLLTQIALLRGDFSEERSQVEQALRIAPASFRIRAAHMQALSPAWKGSYEAMEKFARESQEYAPQNPRLRILPGLVLWDTGKNAARSGDYDRAIKLFTEAMQTGDYAAFYVDRALAYCSVNDFSNALTDTDTALRLYPQAPVVLGHRARELQRLGRMEEAVADLELISKLEPGDYSPSLFVQANLAENPDGPVCEVQFLASNKKTRGHLEKVSGIGP